MSDQGDAGQWRPATSQSDQYSTPDETTGPLPAISGDEADAPGFPSVSEPRGSWSADDDDDAQTGGFPAVPPAPAEEPPAPVERSVFDPVERTDPPYGSSEVADPGPNGTTPRFGTDVPDPDPAPDPGESSFGSFGDSSFGSSSPSSSSSESSFGSSFGSTSFGSDSYGSSYDSSESGKPGESSSESSFGSFRDSSFRSGFDDKPYESPAKPAEPPAPSYGPGTFSSEESGSSSTGAFSVPPPAPKKGVTPEAQAEENEFFASDDHPPMWDKVVAPAGPPPKPGKPSSGNLRLPEWMRDENGEAAPGGPPSGRSADPYEEEGRSKRPLYLGLGVLVAGLIAVAGVYVLKDNGNSQASKAAAPTQTTQTPSSTPSRPAGSQPAPVKSLPRFKGVHTKAAGRVTDARSGLSYARFGPPWALPAKKSPMTELGFSASQFAVTQKAGSQPKYWARLMSAELAGAAKEAYQGPGSERAAATEVAKMYEERMFNFRNKKRVLASQPLNVGGHKGWLVSDYITYHRAGVKATGDVVAVALVDTGKKAPGVLFMSVPNTNKKLWPDVNFVVRSLRVA